MHLDIDSPKSSEDIENILRLATRSCFAEALVRTPVPVVHTFTVNGERIEMGEGG